MRIIHPFAVFDPGNKITWEDGIQVNGTYELWFFEQEKEKETDIIFNIKCLSGMKYTIESDLFESFFEKWF